MKLILYIVTLIRDIWNQYMDKITIKRKSDDKIIINQEKYNLISNSYLSLIHKYQNQYEIKKNPFYADLVNFKTNKLSPKHGWFEYKQGYSETLVKEIIKENNVSKDTYVLDPFTGVGTTNLVAQQLGYQSIGYDINPVAILAAKVKTTYYSQEKIKKISSLINNFSPKAKSKVIPEAAVIKSSFEPKIFENLMFIKGFYEEISDEEIRSFFRLAYISIIERCSTRVKDGNGIKIARNKKRVDDVYDLYINKCKYMLADLEANNFDAETILIAGSMNVDENFNIIKEKQVGIVIFSPPYANCFDYCEVYKLELWMGGFVENYADFSKYRSIALRSHVNAKFNHLIRNPNSDVDLIADTVSCFNIWNKNIPDMIRGYFDDMTDIIKRLYKVMIPGAKCYIVVANSGYRGVLVPTDLLLGDIASKNGFKVNDIIFARKIRASSQQMDLLHNGYSELMRESIVVLQK